MKPITPVPAPTNQPPAAPKGAQPYSTTPEQRESEKHIAPLPAGVDDLKRGSVDSAKK